MEDIWFATRTDDYTFHVDAVKVRRVRARPTAPTASRRTGRKRRTAAFATRARRTSGTIFPYPTGPCRKTPPTDAKARKLLAKLILASSDPGGIVLDPRRLRLHSRDGKKLGRRFVAIERRRAVLRLGQSGWNWQRQTPAIQGLRRRRVLGAQRRPPAALTKPVYAPASGQHRAPVLFVESLSFLDKRPKQCYNGNRLCNY